MTRQESPGLMPHWIMSEERRVSNGVVGYEHDSKASKEVHWLPAPQEIEIVRTSSLCLMYLVRRKDTGETMWLTAGTALSYYLYPPPDRHGRT